MAIDALPPAPSRAAPSTFSALADAFIAALPNFVTQANALATAMNLNSTTATSVTSLTVGTGTQSLTVDTAKSFQPGMTVSIAYTTNPVNWMQGTVVSYNSGTGALVVNVTTTLGSGTYTAWTVAMCGPMGPTNSWTQTSGTFTATPASSSTLTMTTDMTAVMKVGMSLKYVIGGVTYYGRVAAITSNLLTVNGAPLSGSVTALYFGGGILRQVQIVIPGLYEDASNTALIVSDLKSSFQWALPVSYLIYFRVYSNVCDSGTKGQASVRINSTEVNTVAGGLTVAGAQTWYSTVVDIATAAYDINPGEGLEITCVKNGNGDASDLTVQMIFLTP